MSFKSIRNCTLVDAMTMKTKNGLISLVLVICVAAIGPVGKALGCIFVVTQLALLFMYEENGLKVLSFLSANKKTAVAGRFIFVMIVLLASFVIYFIADLAVPALADAYVKGTASFYCILFTASLLLVSVEMPLLYQFGYAQSRTILYGVKFVLFLLVLKAVGKDTMVTYASGSAYHSGLLAIFLFASLLIFLLSIFLSMRIYERKDL